MIRSSILATALLLSLAASGETATLHLNGGTIIREPEQAKPISGRLGDPDALLIQEGALEWEVAQPPTNGFAEFWIKPEKWDAWSEDESVISRFTIGDTEYALTKVAERSELALSDGEGVLQIYPIYGWDENEWVKSIPKKRILQRSVGWHHVHLQVGTGKVRLFVDGFPARIVSDRAPKGAIRKLALEGSPGTRFSVPVVSAGSQATTTKDVRSRFLALFLSQPALKTSVLAVPFLAAKPAIDGSFSEAEWSQAARMTGFGTVQKNQLVKEAVTGYIGYDDEAVYLAVVTPLPAGREHDALADDEAYDVLLGPPFVSGEDPRRLLQFTGDVAGNQQLLQVLPSRIEELAGEWRWKTSRTSSRWVAEASIRFADLGLPQPMPKERWYLNLVNRKANAAWLSPKVERYTTLEDVATIRFEREAPAIRMGEWKISGGTLSVPVTLVSSSFQGNLQAGIKLYSEKDILPLGEEEKTVRVRAGSPTTVHLAIPLGELKQGWVAVSLRNGREDLYQHNVRFPDVVGRPSEKEAAR